MITAFHLVGRTLTGTQVDVPLLHNFAALADAQDVHRRSLILGRKPLSKLTNVHG